MKNAKRIASLLLLCAMLLSASACSEAATENNTDPNDPNAAGQTEVSAEEVEAAPEVDELADNLPDTDLAGYDFRIACWLAQQVPSVYAEEMTGNPVDDAVYEKITTVEDRFNCGVSMLDYGNTASNGEQLYIDAILAGDDTFDVATGHDISIANMTMQGYCLNLYDLPYLDFSKPWWPSQTVNSLTLNGAMYLFSNFISYYNMSDTRVWYFNKTMFNDRSLAYPYEMVYEGTWTLDAMAELLKDSYIDLNGNGAVDDTADSFGAVNNGYYAFREPCNNEPYRHTEDGGMEYHFDVEWYSMLIEKLSKLFYGTAGRISGEGYNAFVENRAMMIFNTISTATNYLSQTDVVYGVLPMPKADENQEQYYGGCTDRPFIVPITGTSHLDPTGLLIEALSAEGYRKVYPAYFEVALKARYADQTDDAKMIDIIMNNNILSFTYMYGNYNSAYSTLMSSMFSSPDAPNTDVASWAAKQEKAQKKYIERLVKVFEEVRAQQQQ